MNFDDEMYVNENDETLTSVAKIFGYNLPGVYEGDKNITKGGYNNEKPSTKKQEYNNTTEWKQNNENDDNVEWKPNENEFDANNNMQNGWNDDNNNNAW